MSIQAVSGYIQGLIEQQGLTAAAVADRAGVRSNYLWRLENGEIKEPSATVLASLIQAVGGNFQVAMDLLVDKAATVNDGVARAVQHVQSNSTTGDDDFDELLFSVALAGLRDPEKFRQVVGKLRDAYEEDTAILDLIEGFIIGRTTLQAGKRRSRNKS